MIPLLRTLENHLKLFSAFTQIEISNLEPICEFAKRYEPDRQLMKRKYFLSVTEMLEEAIVVLDVRKLRRESKDGGSKKRLESLIEWAMKSLRKVEGKINFKSKVFLLGNLRIGL